MARWHPTACGPNPAPTPGRAWRPAAVNGRCSPQYLDHYRLTLELKCEGLTAEQLATRSVPPSTLSLLGLVRHLARVEHSWWRRVLEGHADLPRLYRTDADPDLDFNGAVPDDEVVADAWQSWRTEVAHAREVYAGLDLDALVGCTATTSRPATSSCTSSRSTPGTSATPTCCASASTGAPASSDLLVERRLLPGARDRRREVEAVGRATPRLRTASRRAAPRAPGAGRRRWRCRGPHGSGRRRAGPAPARGRARRRAPPSSAPRAPRAPRTAGPRAPAHGPPRASPAGAAPPPEPARPRPRRRAAVGRGRRGAASAAERPASSRSRPRGHDRLTSSKRRRLVERLEQLVVGVDERPAHPGREVVALEQGRGCRDGRLVDEPGGVDGGDDPGERVVTHPRRQRHDEVADLVDVGPHQLGVGRRPRTRRPAASAA